MRNVPHVPPWALIAVACSAQFLVVLDVSIVNVALPTIRADLGFGAAGLEWVVNAYTLTLAGLLLFGGRVADVFGASRMFLLGLCLFAAASLAGGLAGSPEMLVAARAVQGVGAALLSPTTLTVLLAEFPEGHRKVTALAAWSAAGSVGGASGSVLGGLLTNSWSWRWVLLINVPVGLVILTLSRFVLPRTAPGTRIPLDVPGAVSATLGLTALAYGISAGPTLGWGSWHTYGALGVALVGLSCFLLLQSRTTRHRLVPLEMFRMRSFTWGNALMLLVGGVIFPLWYFVSLHLQEVAGYSAVEAGLAFLPHTLAMLLGARLSPALLRRTGPRALTAIGAGTAALGFLWHSQTTAASPLILGVLIPGVVICFGLALTFTPLAAIATAGVGADRAGLASGVLNTARQVGGALGLAALTSLASVAAPETAPSETYSSGLGAAFLVSAAGCALITLATLLLPETQEDSSPPTTGQSTMNTLAAGRHD